MRIDKFAFDTYVQLELLNLMKSDFDSENVIIAGYG
jgi:hypothetical protein